MEYVDAYIVLGASLSTTYSNADEEVVMVSGFYCPRGAFMSKEEAIEYAKTRYQKTVIVPCLVPKVV